ncbi:hypothetical protein SKAU_G00410630 [Synaphobranchus kaupii]|uniref:Uncharacterized protein n=1 Tax=Synaphobranchus kaupii TaxID=118154 RepID=A0A9Q1E7P2_SYNKA|nr:hypothetical protein SKAU_G00410630 [Synaphobranchus kaupii]
MSSDGQEVMEQSVVEMALPTRRKFRQLTKDQLVRLAAEQEVESVLKGKAQVAFAALDPRMGLEYESLKMAVLTAYGGVPEAYRQRFRTVKRRDGNPVTLSPVVHGLKGKGTVILFAMVADGLVMCSRSVPNAPSWRVGLRLWRWWPP